MTGPLDDRGLAPLIRELIREQVALLAGSGLAGSGAGPLATREPQVMHETVTLGTDEDLAAFVTRLLTLDPADRDDILAGRKRFLLHRPHTAGPPSSVSMAPSGRLEADRWRHQHAPSGIDGAIDTLRSAAERPAAGPAAVRRIERGAVTEGMVRAAARAGERLVLGPRAVLTPLARDRARASGVEITKER